MDASVLLLEGSPPVLTTDRQKKKRNYMIIQDYEDGSPIQDLMEEHNLSSRQIYRIIRPAMDTKCAIQTATPPPRSLLGMINTMMENAKNFKHLSKIAEANGDHRVAMDHSIQALELYFKINDIVTPHLPKDSRAGNHKPVGHP